MVTIKDSREIFAAIDKIWSIISDVDNEPKYWPGINSVHNISKNGNVIEREATVGFRNAKSRQTVILEPKKSVTTKMNEGPMIGTKVTTLTPLDGKKTKIEVTWDFRLDGIPVLFRGEPSRSQYQEQKRRLIELQKRSNSKKMKPSNQETLGVTHKKVRPSKFVKPKNPVPIRLWGLVPRFCLDTIPLISLQSHDSHDLDLTDKNRKKTLT